MIKRQLLFAGVVAATLSGAAHAESLRCQNGIAAEGDSRLAVAYKCGEPALRDNYCAPVFYSGSPYQVPDPIASLYVPCIYTEEWLYERGPGELLAVVRIRRQSAIHHLRPPAAVGWGNRVQCAPCFDSTGVSVCMTYRQPVTS